MTYSKVEDNMYFFFSSRRRHTIFKCDWSSDVCSSDLTSRIVLGNRESREVARGTCPLERDDHVGELVLDRLERPDRHTELLALLGEFERDVEDCLGDADDLERGRDRRLLDRAAQRGCARRLAVAEDAVALDPDAVEIHVGKAAATVARGHAAGSGRGDGYDERVPPVVARGARRARPD